MLVDDHPIQSYVAADIRRTQAIMDQNFVTYPLTVSHCTTIHIGILRP